MTITDLAHKCNKSISYVSNIVNGGHAMSLNALILIADALGVEFSELFAPPAKYYEIAIEELKKHYERTKEQEAESECLLASLRRSMPDDVWERHMGQI